ncbi:MAG: hypothetical protein AB7N91_24945 [Candidatus Tectimicrobiota bacterium]
MPLRLDLAAIESALRRLQQEFPHINTLLQSRRDAMTDEIVEHMLTGYMFVDQALADDIDLLTPRHITCLLELNHLVLCGVDPHVRREHAKHLVATTTRFYTQEAFNIDDILRWYTKHQDDSPWRRAAGVYVRILSQPQLYIEGNHRTGALIMSYILARAGKAPFVLTVENARAYLDPSSLVKATKKTPATLLTKLPRLKKRFASFLKDQEDPGYLLRA